MMKFHQHPEVVSKYMGEPRTLTLCLKRSQLRRTFGRNYLYFFYLSYWSKLDIKYCIDVMHVEKTFVII